MGVASIISSIITATEVQKDGRTWVHELHTDNISAQWLRTYLASQGDNLNTNLSNYAAGLPASLTATEILQNLTAIYANGSLATVTTNYITVNQAGAAVRAAYQFATQTQAIMLGDYLSTLTDVQLQSLFGLTAAQVTNLRTNKLTPAANAAATIRATTGQ